MAWMPMNTTAAHGKTGPPKQSWWVQPSREAFMQAARAEEPRMLKTTHQHATAEGKPTARQAFQHRKVGSMLDQVMVKRG